MRAFIKPREAHYSFQFYLATHSHDELRALFALPIAAADEDAYGRNARKSSGMHRGSLAKTKILKIVSHDGTHSKQL